MNWIPLLAIPILYIGIAYMKPTFSRWVPWNICAMCTAVSLTWASLLVAWIVLEVKIDPLLLGILMGMSATGIMYKSEEFYKRGRVQNFWFVRLVGIVGGLYLIFMILKWRWSVIIPLTVLVLLLIVIASFFFQGLTHGDVVKERENDIDTSLLKKLDNCC